jgi:hypothetical protein
MLTFPEPVRLQVELLSDAFLVRLALDPRHYLMCHLPCRWLHCRQSPRLQQLVQPGQARGPIRDRQVDLRYNHHHLLCLPTIPILACRTRHQVWQCDGMLS